MPLSKLWVFSDDFHEHHQLSKNLTKAFLDGFVSQIRRKQVKVRKILFTPTSKVEFSS